MPSISASASVFIKEPRSPVPLVLEAKQLRHRCDYPGTPGDTCAFWYGNGNFPIGDVNWGFLNLDQWAIRRRATCNSSGGASDRSDYILHNHSVRLGLRRERPTYVCSMTGQAMSNWQDLNDRMSGGYADWPGSTIVLPVSDCHQQVDDLGNIVPCGAGTPDKFVIVGFARFRIMALYRGDDPAAVGTPEAASTGSCGEGVPLTLNKEGVRNLAVLANVSCEAPDFRLISQIPFSGVEVTSSDGSTTYTKCPPAGGISCDYLYDETSFSLTWVSPDTRPDPNKFVRLSWSEGTPGACGLRSADPNAICLVLQFPTS